MDIKETSKTVGKTALKTASKAASKTKKVAMTSAISKVMALRGRKVLRELDNNSKHAIEITNNLLFKLLDENKDTEYGKKYDFANIHTIEDYKKKVPFSTYDDYEPYIRRMVENGETNLLTVRDPKHYALSSGSVGNPKHIPVSQEELDKFKAPSDRIVLASWKDYDVQTLLMRCSLLITDYSSVFFDVGYMEKPVIYYQFDLEDFRKYHYQEGYFSAEKHGFGPVARTEEEVMDALYECAGNDFRVQEEYRNRLEAFFPVRDENNCERTYRILSRMSGEK